MNQAALKPPTQGLCLASTALAQVFSVGLWEANLCQSNKAQVGKRSIALLQTASRTTNMKKIIGIAICLIIINQTKAQTNLVSNPSFEEYWGACSPFRTAPVGFNYSFDSLSFQGVCVLKDWISVSYSPDAFSLNLSGYGFPSNFYSKHIYPHSDSSCVGGDN